MTERILFRKNDITIAAMKQTIIILSTFLIATFSALSCPEEVIETNPIEIVDQWTHLYSENGLEVQYKVQECNNLNVRNQVLVLFRFINSSSTEVKTINWSVKEFRNGECYNCDGLDSPEFKRTLTLSPGEILEGDGSSKADKRVYLFSHFIDLVPGMSDQKLTDFEFVNVEVINLATRK